MNLPGLSSVPYNHRVYFAVCFSFYQIKKEIGDEVHYDREKTECRDWVEVLEGGIEFRQA
jgi:hypothetical protein